MEKAEIAIIREKNQKDCPPPPTNFPWLLFKHYKSTKEQTFYSLSENKSYVRSIPELVSHKIWNSYHGWLILSNDSDQFSLWNPVSLETISLPCLELDPKSRITSCILSSSPSNPDTTFFLLDKGIFTIWFCRLQNQKQQYWSKHCYKEEIQVLLDSIYTNNYIDCPTCCGNTVYCKVSRVHMAVRIDFIEPNSLVLQPVEMPIPRESLIMRFRKQYLIGSLDEELFVVSTFYDTTRWNAQIRGIDIHKLDLSSMVWEQVESAKDRAFFISEDDGSSCSAIMCSKKTGNRVYLTRLDDNCLYSIHIVRQDVLLSLPCPNMTAPWVSRKWVMPS